MRTPLRSPIAACAAILLCLSQTNAAPPGGYYLVWSDEFNGSSLDSSKWGYWSGGYHDAVNTSSAISVSGGNLTITTYTSGGTHYTGIVESRNRFHPRYGFLEARINYDSSAGMWSAFWLQADHEDDCPFQERFLNNPYYAGSEIDICEHRSQDSSGNNISGGVNTYIHYNGYSGYCQGWGTTVGPSPNPYGSGLGTGFHTYGLLWNSSECQFYVDNAWKYSTSSGVSGTPEWILLSSIVDGASWAGGIPGGGYGSLGSSSTKMIVDYVRYYAPTNQVYWNGGTSIYWTNSANWIAGRSPKPNEEVVFSTLSAADTCNLATNFAIRKIVFLDGGGFTLNGGTLSLGSGGVDVASTGGNVTFNSPVQLTANQNWHVGPDRTLTMAGPLSGTNSLTKDGWSLLVLSGNNSNFTGTINVDTASTGSDDGALRLKSSAAISNAASPIWIRNNNNGKSRLELDGSSGNLVITKDISIAARNSSASAILNTAGSNTLAGDLILQVGGANYWIECTGGTLNLAGAIPVSTPGGARTITLRGDSPTIVTGTIQNGTGGGTVSVQKAGSGTGTLQGSNTFTGTLYVDSNSTTGNDGVLRLKSSGAVASAASPILIRNNTSGSSTLQLDGSGGSITVPQSITLSGRNNAVPAIQNFTGSNTLAGGVTINVGGSDYRFQADAGTLALGGTVTAAAAGGARNLTFQGAGNFNVSANIQNGSANLGIIKTNTGRLTMSGNNTYTGPTAIYGGTLALAGSGSMANSSSILVGAGAVLDVSQAAFTLAAGQTLAGSGVVTGAVAAVVGSRISPGTSAGTLNFANGLTLSGGVTNAFELSTSLVAGAGINDLIVVTGDLNLSGTNVLALTPVNGKLSSGRYKLIQYSGALTGGATNFSIAWVGFPPVAAVALDDTVAGEIALVVTFNPQSLVWQGDGAANLWDIGTSTNWLAGVSNAVFFPGDDVTFDDSSANRTVALSLSLVPSSVAVNSSGDYTFTGSGKITGATGLEKSGAGTLTLLTTNDYSGPTTINAGTLQVGNGTTSGMLGTGPIFDDGILLFNQSDTQVVASVISGSGMLVKSGGGTLILPGNNSFTGGTLISGGSVNLDHAAAVGIGPLTLDGAVKRIVLTNGSVLENSITLSPGIGSGTIGQGTVTGPPSGSATINGPINVTSLPAAGGVFDGGNGSAGLVLGGPVTSTVTIVHRANRLTFSGGGSFPFLQTFSSVVLGANDGLATNAVLELGTSGFTGTFDLAGFDQTLNGLVKASGSGTVGNSSTTRDSVLTVAGLTTNSTYAGVIADSLSGGTRKVALTVAAGTFTLSGANTFSGDTRAIGGSLIVGSGTALQNSTLNLAADDLGTVTFGSFAAATVGGLKGARNLSLTNASGTALALTVGNNFTGTNIYYGTLVGNGSVTKTGPGTQVLAGNNTFTGILNVDTAQPSTGNDGALRLAGALTSASAIQIRNQNSATSTLQLDGSLANISLPQPVLLNGRNNATPAIVNLAGDNTFAGNISLGSGGTTYTFQCDADTLVFGGVVGIQSLTSARPLTFQGGGNFWISGAITNGSSWPNSVVKLGAGTLTLAGVNTYTGPTTVTNGGLRVNGVSGTNTLTFVNATLSGDGVIRGPVTMSGSSTLAPGNGVGTLTISNNLTLPSLTLMELDRSAVPNSDRLNAASLGYAGTLIVTNVGARLQVGDTFDLFNWSTRSGNFTTVILPLGYNWDSSNLNVDGTITVTAVEPSPILNVANSGGMLEFTWSSSFTYKLQVQWSTANVGLIPSEEAWFDYPGGETSPVSVPIDPEQPAMFFRLAPGP